VIISKIDDLFIYVSVSIASTCTVLNAVTIRKAGRIQKTVR